MSMRLVLLVLLTLAGLGGPTQNPVVIFETTLGTMLIAQSSGFF